MPRKTHPKKSRFDRCFGTCPGAWTGSDPENGTFGVITVDAGQIEQALKHVRKYYRIARTYIPENPPYAMRQAVFLEIWPLSKP